MSSVARFVRPLARLTDVGHPFLFAAAFVLERFAGSNAAIHELWRPLLVGQLLVGATLATLVVILRRRRLAALVTAVVFAVLAGYTAPALVLTAIILWRGLITAMRRARRRVLQPSDAATRIAFIYSVALFAVALTSTIWVLWPRIGTGVPLAVSDDTRGGPDIYVLLLDGYPRGDTLASEFGIDNSAFLDDLASLGFSVADDAKTNYNKTWLTVGSLLDGRYVHERPELVDARDGPQSQMRLLHEVIDGAAILDVLRTRSYEVISIPSPVTTTDVLADARVLLTGHLNAFEVSLLSRSLVARVDPQLVLTFLTGDQRANVFDQLGLMRRVASDHADRPRLVLTHLMSPHLPFLLGQDPDYLGACFPHCDFYATPLETIGISEAEFGSRLQIQLNTLNEAVLGTLEHVIAADPNAFIIVMSDHGIRHRVANWEEHFRSFFAARTPGHEETFASDTTPVNVFRRVLTRAFGENLPDLQYEAWRSDWDEPLLLTRFR